jgi:N-acetylated-alpha-linked acidic dipeptidase
MLELTKALGALAKSGVRPKRTLVFGAWDGEEVTLTGSTEWGEQFRDELRQKAVAYLNVDSAASGPNLELSAVGTLAPAIVDITRDLTSPAGGSLYDAWRRAGSGGGSITSGARKDGELVVTRIGSGSDHTVFINHVGVPVVDMTFNGPYGVYHSAYDSHHWVATIGDPGFRYSQAMAQLWGTMALRFANAELLPFDVPTYAGAIDGFITQLKTIPQAETRLDTAPLVAAVGRLNTAGATLSSRMTRALAAGPLRRETADAVNRELLAFERTWLHEPGIPGRAWFKHLLYAPRYTYAAMSLPGVTEAAEAGDWTRAQAQLALLVAKADENTARVTRAAELLDRSPRK